MPLSGETAASVQAKVRPLVEELKLPDGYRIEWGGEYESSTDAQSALFASMPIGIMNDIMLISIKDWETKDSYNLIRWATNFDYLSINCLLSINPSPVQDSFKLMLIYNH